MVLPVRATYRLQLRGESSGFGFTFADAEELLDYLDDLGISHLYLSPIMTAVRGSSHGYDVTDPAAVTEEMIRRRIVTPRLRSVRRRTPSGR